MKIWSAPTTPKSQTGLSRRCNVFAHSSLENKVPASRYVIPWGLCRGKNHFSPLIQNMADLAALEKEKFPIQAFGYCLSLPDSAVQQT